MSRDPGSFERAWPVVAERVNWIGGDVICAQASATGLEVEIALVTKLLGTEQICHEALNVAKAYPLILINDDNICHWLKRFYRPSNFHLA